MKKRNLEEITLKVNKGLTEIVSNSLVRYFYLAMAIFFVVDAIFFGISCKYIPTFYGGLMSAVFLAIYMIGAFLVVCRGEEHTFISLLYLILIYCIPCLWMGISYIFDQTVGPVDIFQICLCGVSIALAIVGISSYFANNIKNASLFALISILLTIGGLILGGISEFSRVVDSAIEGFMYIPLVGIGFFVEAGFGFLPLVYLFRTI